MQIASVKIGNSYAVNHEGKDRALRVTEITTVRDSSKTTNYVGGWYENYDEGAEETRVKLKVPVSELIMEFEKHSKLVAERKAREEAEVAEKKRLLDRQWLAIQLLAKAIGRDTQAVKDRYKPYGTKKEDWKSWDEKAAAVYPAYSSIEINEYAVEKIISAFGHLDVEG